MKFSHLTLLVAILVGNVAWSQTAPPPPKGETTTLPKDPYDDPAERAKLLPLVLKNWANAMGQLEAFDAVCRKTIKDKDAADIFEGKIQLMRPNLARMELTHTKNANQTEKIISDGKNIYEYRPLEKKVVVHKIAADGKGKVGEAGGATIIDFLFGMTPDEIQKNYDISLGKVSRDDPEIKGQLGPLTYALIDIKPKRPEDVKDFKKAELAIWISSKKDHQEFAYLPARLWFQGPGERGDETTWQFAIRKNPKLKAGDFKAELPDAKWSWVLPKEADSKVKPASGSDK